MSTKTVAGAAAPELEARRRLLSLLTEARRLVRDDEDLDDVEAYCSTCEGRVALFIGCEGWRHFELAEYLLGPGAKLVDRDHEPVVAWRRPRIAYLIRFRLADLTDEPDGLVVVAGTNAKDAERRWRHDEGGDQTAQAKLQTLSVEPLGDRIVSGLDEFGERAVAAGTEAPPAPPAGAGRGARRGPVLRVGRWVEGCWDAREALQAGDLVTTPVGCPAIVVGRLGPGRVVLAEPPELEGERWSPRCGDPRRLERGWPRWMPRVGPAQGDCRNARYA